MNEDIDFKLDNSKESLEILRHSTAHLMAQAIKSLYPEAKFFVGPVIEDGFYYDFKVDSKIGDEDLKTIDKKMREILKKKHPIQRYEITKKEAIDKFLNDDLNFPRALSYMWEILRDDRLNNSEKYELVLRFDQVFGLDLDKEEKIKIPEKVKKLVKEREMLRKKKEWKKADEIRKKINKSGFIIEDVKGGVRVKKK